MGMSMLRRKKGRGRKKKNGGREKGGETQSEKGRVREEAKTQVRTMQLSQ
jgi:hypothetical protein